MAITCQSNGNHAARLLLIEGVVLHHSRDACRVHAAHVRRHQLRSQVRILAANILEVTTVTSDSVDVERGAQDDIGALSLELLP